MFMLRQPRDLIPASGIARGRNGKDSLALKGRANKVIGNEIGGESAILESGPQNKNLWASVRRFPKILHPNERHPPIFGFWSSLSHRFDMARQPKLQFKGDGRLGRGLSLGDFVERSFWKQSKWLD